MLPIEVLANPECAHCLKALDEVADAAVRAGVPVAGIDLRQHPELAMLQGFEHSPLFRVGDRTFPDPLDGNLLRRLIEAARR